MRPGPERALGGFADLLKDRDSAHLSTLPALPEGRADKEVWMGGQQPAEQVCAEDRVQRGSALWPGRPQHDFYGP